MTVLLPTLTPQWEANVGGLSVICTCTVQAEQFCSGGCVAQREESPESCRCVYEQLSCSRHQPLLGAGQGLCGYKNKIWLYLYNNFSHFIAVLSRSSRLQRGDWFW